MFKWYHYSTVSLIYWIIITTPIGLRHNSLFIFWLLGFLAIHLLYCFAISTDAYNWQISYKHTDRYSEYSLNALLGRVEGYNTFLKKWEDLSMEESDDVITCNASISMVMLILLNMLFGMFYSTMVLLQYLKYNG